MTSDPLVHPAIGIAMLLTCFVVLIFFIRYLQHACGLEGEMARKLFHSVGALAALVLPWLFESEWPVLVVTSSIFVALYAIRRVVGLRDTVGRVVHSVDRRSIGDICWPIGVGVTFVVADSATAFCAAILVFAFADPAAALVGTRFGRHRYKAAGGGKSLEGSSAFFVTTFLIVAFAAPFDGAHGIPLVLSIAAGVSVLLTLIEASVCRGLDNALVPTVGVAAFGAAIAAPGTALLMFAGTSMLLLTLLAGRNVTLRPVPAITAGESI